MLSGNKNYVKNQNAFRLNDIIREPKHSGEKLTLHRVLSFSGSENQKIMGVDVASLAYSVTIAAGGLLGYVRAGKLTNDFVYFYVNACLDLLTMSQPLPTRL